MPELNLYLLSAANGTSITVPPGCHARVVALYADVASAGDIGEILSVEFKRGPTTIAAFPIGPLDSTTIKVAAAIGLGNNAPLAALQVVATGVITYYSATFIGAALPDIAWPFDFSVVITTDGSAVMADGSLLVEMTTHKQPRLTPHRAPR